MKKTIFFLTALIFIVSFAVGCKSSEAEELKEQVAELSEKLAEEDSVDRVEEVEVVGGEEEAILVPWNEAKYHIGEMATVYGPVVATYYDEAVDEGITFLNIGKDYPDPEGFSVWIDRYNRPNFFKAPEIYYSGKDISVTGLIIKVDDLPHMEITDPNQISINEEVEEAVEEPVEEETEEQPVEEVVEETEPIEEIAEETEEEKEDTTPQGPSRGTYLNNVLNVINEYNLLINHWNTFYQDYDDIGSVLEFGRSVLNKLGEINDMLKNITPASGFEGAQAHLIDLANTMYNYQQQQINYLEDGNIDGCNTMVNNFNNTYQEFINYYNNL